MVARRGLGKGLSAILGDNPAETGDLLAEGSAGFRSCAIEKLKPNRYQPRRDFDDDALNQLAASIKQHGILQPIVVRPHPQQAGCYEIIAGERRWRAAQRAGLHQLPISLREADEHQSAALALIENIQRQDLNAMEKALALQRLLDEFSMTHQAIAESLGSSRSAVSNYLRLLQLCPAVRLHLQRGDMEMGHARALLSLSADLQQRIAERVLAQGLSVRETEKIVQQLSQPSQPKATVPRDANITHLEKQLSEQMGARVKISHQASGAGSISIRYHNLEQLDGILERWSR